METFEEKLFKKFQKDKWEIKTLGEISKEKIFQGNSKITQKSPKTGNFPAVTSEDIFNSWISIDKCKIFVDESFFNRSRKLIETGDLLILLCDFQIENIGKACAYLCNEKCLAGNHVTVLKHNQNSKYLSYVFSSKFIKEQIKNLLKPSTKPYINLEDINKLKIPLPPLEIQNQIANFLDKFMSLKGEMEKEMKRRMEQYQHYKELHFKSGIKKLNWKIVELEKASEKIYRKDDTITHTYKYPGDYPALTGKTVFESSMYIENCEIFVDPTTIKKPKYVEKGDLVMLVDGFSNLGKTSLYLGEEKCLLGNSLTLIKHNQNPKYLINALTAHDLKEQIKSIIKKGVVSHIYVDDIKKLKIPLPPLEEQEKIVKQLDKLYEIAHDMNNGIPKMIELSQKQYEYYKEKLLNL